MRPMSRGLYTMKCRWAQVGPAVRQGHHCPRVWHLSRSQGNPKPLPSSYPLCAEQLKELEASRKHWQEWMCSRAPSPGQGREATVCPQPSHHCHGDCEKK